jgi:hypothetical protein
MDRAVRRKYSVIFDEDGRVAQLVEQCPFKAWVEGSNPSALTIPAAVLPFCESEHNKSRKGKLPEAGVLAMLTGPPRSVH